MGTNTDNNLPLVTIEIDAEISDEDTYTVSDSYGDYDTEIELPASDAADAAQERYHYYRSLGHKVQVKGPSSVTRFLA